MGRFSVACRSWATANFVVPCRPTARQLNTKSHFEEKNEVFKLQIKDITFISYDKTKSNRKLYENDIIFKRTKNSA